MRQQLASHSTPRLLDVLPPGTPHVAYSQVIFCGSILSCAVLFALRFEKKKIATIEETAGRLAFYLGFHLVFCLVFDLSLFGSAVFRLCTAFFYEGSDAIKSAMLAGVDIGQIFTKRTAHWTTMSVKED